MAKLLAMRDKHGRPYDRHCAAALGATEVFGVFGAFGGRSPEDAKESVTYEIFARSLGRFPRFINVPRDHLRRPVCLGDGLINHAGERWQVNALDYDDRLGQLSDGPHSEEVTFDALGRYLIVRFAVDSADIGWEEVRLAEGDKGRRFRHTSGAEVYGYELWQWRRVDSDWSTPTCASKEDAMCRALGLPPGVPLLRPGPWPEEKQQEEDREPEHAPNVARIALMAHDKARAAHVWVSHMPSLGALRNCGRVLAPLFLHHLPSRTHVALVIGQHLVEYSTESAQEEASVAQVYQAWGLEHATAYESNPLKTEEPEAALRKAQAAYRLSRALERFVTAVRQALALARGELLVVPIYGFQPSVVWNPWQEGLDAFAEHRVVFVMSRTVP